MYFINIIFSYKYYIHWKANFFFSLLTLNSPRIYVKFFLTAALLHIRLRIRAGQRPAGVTMPPLCARSGRRCHSDVIKRRRVVLTSSGRGVAPFLIRHRAVITRRAVFELRRRPERTSPPPHADRHFSPAREESSVLMEIYCYANRRRLAWHLRGRAGHRDDARRGETTQDARRRERRHRGRCAAVTPHPTWRDGHVAQPWDIARGTSVTAHVRVCVSRMTQCA